MTYAFNERREELKKLFSDDSSEYYLDDEEMRKLALEDEDYYLEAGILYIPEEARWDYLVKNANQPNIAEIIENAIEILENKYPKQLRDVIPKVYTSSNLDHYDLSFLINLFSKIDFGYDHKASDIFGRIYEYFPGKFTEVEGKKGGKFYTPRSLTKLIVEVLDIKGGRMFDPACGSGGFFVSAIEKLEKEGIDKFSLQIYGQDSDQMAWKLTKINLVIRGVEGEIRKAIVKADLVYGIVTCPPKLFYNVSLPVSLWFVRREKPEHMKGKVLFVNAKDLFEPISRRQNVMKDEHISRIVEKFRLFEEGKLDEIDEIGFAKVATIEEIAKNGYVLTPRRYVGVKIEIDDERTFDEKMREYSEELSKLLKEEEELKEKIKGVFEALGYKLG